MRKLTGFLEAVLELGLNVQKCFGRILVESLLFQRADPFSIALTQTTGDKNKL